MKKIILLVVFALCFAETYEDVIYLKDGSVIRGIIIEQAPNEYIKIQSGQNIFVYQINEVEKIKKEISISNEEKYDKDTENWYFSSLSRYNTQTAISVTIN